MYAEYDEYEVLHRDPVELVRLLHSKAIEKLNLARTLTGESRIRERNRAVAHVAEIVVELQGSLDVERGGEIAASLERLYEYMQLRLAEALAERREEPLAEVGHLLGALAEGWREASAALREPEPVEDEGLLAGSARSWTL